MTRHFQIRYTIHKRILQLMAIIAIILLLGNLPGLQVQADEPEKDTASENVLAALQASFADLDEYGFTAQIEQTLIPRATAVNIGQTEEQIDSQLIGTVTPEKSTLDLRFEGGGIPNLLLEQVDGQTFLIRDGERTLIENPLSATAPDGSFAGYLHAATNLVERPNPDFPDYTIYQFELDGQAFANYLVEQAEANLPANQQYRVYPSAFAASIMNGRGELWLDSEGVLRRQIVDMDIPEMNDQYDLRSHIVIDYKYNNNASETTGLPDTITSTIANPAPDESAPQIEEVAQAAPGITASQLFTFETILYLFLTILVIGFVYILLRRPQKIRVALPVSLALLMVVNPLLLAAAGPTATAESSPPSLVEALLGEQETQEDSIAPNLIDARTSMLQQTENECGVSDDRTTDTDGDGLTDFVENCIGTNPYTSDTDTDFINDYKEVTGFVFTDTVKGPITYYTNPLEPDSNFDGRSDFDEWPTAYQIAEWNQVAEVTTNPWDLDGDNQPNLWDIDDDGDGVYDGLDLNPEHVTDHQEHFLLNLYQGDRTQPGVYTVIEFQVQPQDLTHLRYSTSSLDWPEGDDEGTIQDTVARDSRHDLTLTPYLRAYTRHLPTQEMMDLYGIAALPTDVDGWYDMYIPLAPIGDGGRIEAFAGKVIYDMGDVSGDFGWHETKLVWFANFKQDDGSTNIIAEYEEDAYRFAGLDISRQTNYDFAVLGTPNSQNDNRDLYQLMAALDVSYLASLQITLNALTNRFNTSTTPLTRTWGIPADDVTVMRPAAAPGFSSAISLSLAETVENYLNTHAYPYDDLATLIVAMEGEIGTLSLGNDEDSDIVLNGNSFDAKLYYVPMSTVRSTNMTFMTYDGNGWGGAEAIEIGEVLTTRYDVDAIADAMQADYPGVTGDKLITTIASNTSHLQEGNQVLIKHDRLIMVPITVDDQAVMEVVEKPDAPDIFSYTLDVSGIGVQGEGLAFDTFEGYKLYRYDIPSQLDWSSPTALLQSIWGLVPVTRQSLVIDFFGFDYSPSTTQNASFQANSLSDVQNNWPDPALDEVIFEEVATPEGEMYKTPETPGTSTAQGEVYHEQSIAEELGDVDAIADEDLVITEGLDEADGVLPDMPEGAQARKSIDANVLDDLDVDQIEIVDDVADANAESFEARYFDDATDIDAYEIDVDNIDFDTPTGVRQADEVAEAASWLVKVKKAYNAVKKPLQVFFAVLDVLGLAAEVTFLWLEYLNFSSLYQYERREALAYAITITVILTVVTLLSYVFPGFGFAVFVIEMIFLLIDLIARADGYKIDSRQEFLKGAFGSIYDAEALTKVATMQWRGVRFEELGSLTAGNRLIISDYFTGVIQAAYQDKVSHLNQSSSYGFFRVESQSESLSITESRNPETCTDAPTYFYDSAAHTTYSHSKVCGNKLQATVNFDAPVKNGVVSIQPVASFDTRFQVCILDPDGEDCADKRTQTVVLPDELPEENQWGYVELVLDVLPATLDELWNWSVFSLDTSDRDADGLTYDEELNIHALNPDNWDTDGDTISDRFEIYQLEPAGAFPVMFDSDRDGLDDGTELRLGTNIGVRDSDGDGIDDGDEVPHYDAETDTWVHGGGFITIDGDDYFVFLSPLTSDLDRDGLSDSNELSSVNTPVTTAHTTALRFNTSPYVVNSNVPSVSFTAEPRYQAPNGQIGVYVAEGDAVTATLQIADNYASSTVNGIVQLCLPDVGLTNMAVQTSGVRPDVIPTQDGSCYRWDFRSSPLLSSENFTAVATGIAEASSTVTSTITANVPYNNLDGNFHIANSEEFYLDNDDPSVSIYQPMPNTRLAGDFFVMGGSSSDPSTWIDYVAITLPASGGTGIATDTAPWAYTWELPDEGEVTVTAVAYDVVGNASPPYAVTVDVDSLAPIITTSFADGATIAAGESYSDTIELSGTVSDNYAGVVRVQMATNNQPWRTIWSSDTPQTGTTWSGTWELPAITESAQGEHTLRLRAFDDFGNIGLLEQTVFVDLLPPTNELTDRRFTGENPAHVPLGPLTLQGVANDAGRNPLASGPIPLEGTLDSFDDATVWLQPDSHEADDAGVTVAWIGDYNGDRLGDMAVGFPNGADGRGKVVVVAGRAGDWPNPNLSEMEQLFGKTPTFLGVEGAGLGATIAPVGDFDGDGFEDFIMGDLANNRLFLVYGTLVAQSSELILDDVNYGYWDLIPAETETFTTQFAAAGDVNNDSYSDLIVATDSAVYLLAGDRSPIPSLNLAAAKMVVGNASVAGVGDVTGDFMDDFVIATGGTVYLFAGSSGWVEGGLSGLTTAMATASFATSDASPTLINAGDLNNDGFADFAFSNGTAPVVVYGSNSGSYATQTLGGFPSALTGFLASAGDTNKDGLSDLLVGNAAGEAYLLLGGNLGTAAATIANVADTASAPYTQGADLTGDGSADLLIVPSNSGSFVSGLPQAQPGFIPQNALPDRSVADPATNPATATGDVTVGDGNADYSSIQAAIDSGASRVLIQPGVYYEAITLTNNIVVAGSGAGLTTLMMPEGESVLVTADGVTNTSLLNLSLKSETGGVGVIVRNGAAVDMERLLIEELQTAVLIDGAAANVDFKNNSFIANDNGIFAIDCAGIDVRNTIFAYNSGVALAYETCAAIQRHEFNLFYANGIDQSPNDPGSGELFSNPLFYSYATGDYRVEAVSPVINAGSPGDSVPPGAGSRIDIGHIEQSGGSYIASPTYCSSCDNDGLIWGVNAFNTIQDAVDAAEDDLLNLFGGDGTPFTVGVDEGTYNESVTINWNLQLLGSDPDKTTIQGVGGPAVTISATVGTKVSGFTLIGGGASPIGVHVTGGSNSIAVTRNLIKDNVTGIFVDQRSSGMAQFNTIVANTTGVLVNGRYNWLDTDSNLISNNTNGLFAETSFDQIQYQSGITTTEIAGSIFSDNNLLFNSVDYTNVITGVNDIVGSDPLVSGPYALLTLGSPAIDEGSIFTAVPAGGGLAPDIGWHELTIPPISVLMGQADDSIAFESYGVGSVEYAIVPVADATTPVTSTLPITWTAATLTSPDAKLTYWNTGFTPTSTGFYRIYSRAVDGLGNAETDITEWYDGAFYVDDAAPIVSFSYESIENAEDTWLRLTGVVTDYVGSSFDVEDVYFMVDGVRYNGRWSLDAWEADGSTGRTFHAMYMNETSGTQLVDIQAFAVDGAGQIGSSALQSDVFVDRAIGGRTFFDATGPVISDMTLDDGYITAVPPFWNNNLYTGTITFEGVAADPSISCSTSLCPARSGINGYQISFDGGLTWDTMERTVSGINSEHNGSILPYNWPIPNQLDATTIPFKIRATDYAGNSQSFVYTATVDTGPPRIVGNINLLDGPAAGQHIDEEGSLDLTWTEHTDGSGLKVMLGTFGQTNPEIPPTAVQPTNIRLDAPIREGDEWYAVVGAKDEVGNEDWIWVGPWYAGDIPRNPSGILWQGVVQSLLVTGEDGYIDLAHNEYVVENEWLDTDPRGPVPLSLYNAWSSNSSYIGVGGANWETDGAFFVYYDLANGGTTIPISATGTITLPFEADFALSFNGTIAQSWQFNGTTWVEESSQAAGVDLETKGMQMDRYFAPYSNLENADHHRMVAYAVNDDNELWATFPRNNDLSGMLTTFYEWHVTQYGGELLELPTNAQSADLVMVVESDPIASAPLTHGSIVTTAVTLRNLTNAAVTDVLLDVVGSTGVTYQTVNGATCVVCPPAGSVQVAVDEVAAGATAVVTIIAQLDPDLTGLDAVTTTVTLRSDASNNDVDTISHRLDLLAPIVTIAQIPGDVIDTVQPRLLGNADDRAGIGLARVEFSLDQSTWVMTTGTNEWAANLDLTGQSGSTVDIYVRATDLFGQTSTPISKTVVLDDVAPVMTTTVPALVGNAVSTRLTGTASDPAPVDARVATVQIQIDGAAWQTVNLNAANANGEHGWWYNWQLPREDGVQHEILYRAYDYAGNVTLTSPYVTVVDTVAPTVTITQQLTQVDVGSSEPVLAGTVTDGGGFDAATLLIYPSVGGVISETVAVDNGQWSIVLNQPLGQYTLLVRFVDTIGNEQLVGPFGVEVVESAGNVLTVTVTGNGSVTSDPAGIDCGTDCSESYTDGTVVTLTAVADADSTFTGWSGACTGAEDCVVTMTEARSVTATFSMDYRLYLPLVLK